MFRKGHVKGDASFGFGTYPYVALMPLCNLLDNRQAQPRSLNALGIISAHEQTENLLGVFRPYPNAVVLNGKDMVFVRFFISNVDFA